MDNLEHLSKLALELCRNEGVLFSARTNKETVVVECTFLQGNKRYILFEDHRTENSHSNVPHICNQWSSAVGAPISFTFGEEITNHQILANALQAAAVMCITQSDAYKAMKAKIFA